MLNKERVSRVNPSESEPLGAMRPRVLLLASDLLFPHFFPESALLRLNQIADFSRYAGEKDSQQLRAQMAESDALMTTWHSPFLHGEMFDTCPRVRLVAHSGGEVKARIAAEVFDRVTVTNASEPMAAPVAEMALALMLTLIRKLPQYAAEMRVGLIRTNASVSEGETLRGRRVGLVGFGRIGQCLARLIEPLGGQLHVADPYCSAAVVAASKGRLVSLDELLHSCSVVVLAAGLTPETRNLLDRRRLALMPEGAYLINIARGGLIDTEALIVELRAGRISAALDVTDPLEPLPPDHELRRLPNVLLTPHIAAGGLETRRAMGDVAVGEVVRFFKGEPLQNVVTREMLATMT